MIIAGATYDMKRVSQEWQEKNLYTITGLEIV